MVGLGAIGWRCQMPRDRDRGWSVGRSVVSGAVAIRAGVVTAVTCVSVDRPAASAVVCHAISLTGTGLQVVSLSAPLQ